MAAGVQPRNTGPTKTADRVYQKAFIHTKQASFEMIPIGQINSSAVCLMWKVLPLILSAPDPDEMNSNNSRASGWSSTFLPGRLEDIS
jgi:hypothetical protein